MQVLLGGNRQIESQQGAAAGDALLDQLQEAGIAVLVANPLAGRAAGVPLADVGGLRWFLGALPGGPRLALDPLELLELDLADQVEVA